MTDPNETELAEMLRLLKPAPAAWVEAAREIPRMRKQISEVLPYLSELAGRRAVETSELERVIEAAGMTPEPRLVAELQRYLAGK